MIVSIIRGLWEHMKSSIAVLHNSTERSPSILIYINKSLVALSLLRMREAILYRLYCPLCVSRRIDTWQIVYLSNKDPCPKISIHKSEIKVP